MCHQDDPRKDCADQLVSLFAIYIAILSVLARAGWTARWE